MGNVHDTNQRLTSSHLERKAYLYVRQSTLRQVVENTESTKRQYALKQKAQVLGWGLEDIVVIDSDLGKSGARSDREGFQRLVAEVGMGSAGIVMGLEVSRLARNCTDWHRLLEICALSNTLILDEEGLYDPSNFNDRLLLGLKGTMSEAELHLIRARLQGGLENKARRGELRIKLPIGYVYGANDKIIFDPDLQVQSGIRQLFKTFQRTGSAYLTVKIFNEKNLKFPRKPLHGVRKGEILWVQLTHSRVLQTIHNPIYTGSYIYGRRKSVKGLNGKTTIKKLEQDKWGVLIHDNHPGYITWEEYQSNQKKLLENAHSHGSERQKSPAREGGALLQGIVICGSCGKRMTIRYNKSKGKTIPYYICQSDGIKTGTKICQSIPGGEIGDKIENILLEIVNTVNIEVTLAVEQEFQDRINEVDNMRKQQVERARYEADIARQRYMHVDPRNRLVAESLEVEWNEKLRLHTETQEDYERHYKEARLKLSDQKEAEIKMLLNNFPKIWKDVKTPQRERKRLLRLIIKDVTLIKEKEIDMHIRFQGGKNQTFILKKPKCAWEVRKTESEVIEEIDKLLDNYTHNKVANILNKKNMRTGTGIEFTSRIISKIRSHHNLKSREVRLRKRGMLTTKELAEKLDVSISSIKTWRRAGLLECTQLNDRGDHMYENIEYELSGKSTWKMPKMKESIKSLTAKHQ